MLKYEPMMRVETLMRTPLLTFIRSEHMPGTIRYGTEEEDEVSHDVTFVEAGEFDVNGFHLSEGSMLVQRAGTVHRYTHREDFAPDVCLTVRFADICDRDLATCSIAPRVTNRLAYLRWRLAALFASADPIAADCWAAELLGALRDTAGDSDRLHRPSQLRWYAERVDAVRSMLEEHYASPHTLASIAASVAISPFQFARVFRRLTGSSPHQYLMQVRLDAARRMLLDGAPVTTVCYDSGFSNLSHFIHMFKRRFGCTPSAL